jgi:hypothetical protein
VYLTSKGTHSRPSQLLCLNDALVAYQFDCAVVTFGTIVENALQETVEVQVGDKTRTRPKYNLNMLLDDGFQFPQEEPLDALKALDGYEEVR